MCGEKHDVSGRYTSPANQERDRVQWDEQHGKGACVSLSALVDDTAGRGSNMDRISIRATAAQIKAVLEFAERGYAKELGAVDARHHYSADKMAKMKRRFANGLAGMKALAGSVTDAERFAADGAAQ